ncbi:MAG: type II secretion system protein GspG [Planctomycetota bacterium]|nr:type II secretion system protein GspG [Planctomycetota bacterium]
MTNRQYGRPSPAAAGFTLVEMLVVLAIVAVLGGLILTAVNAARKRSQVNQTKTIILQVEQNLETYASDFHEYPPSDGEDGVKGNERMVEALRTEEMNGPYLGAKEFYFKDVNNNGLKEIVDAWGRPLHYVHHRDYGREPPNKRTFRLYSAGYDGRFEPLNPDGDDIVNWNKSEADTE